MVRWGVVARRPLARQKWSMHSFRAGDTFAGQGEFEHDVDTNFADVGMIAGEDIDGRRWRGVDAT